jgi:hypothetical protein
VLSGYSRDQARGLGERLQAEISNFALEVRPGRFARVGLRFGVAEHSVDGHTVDDLLNAAASGARTKEITRKHVESSIDPRELRLVPLHPPVEPVSPLAANE